MTFLLFLELIFKIRVTWEFQNNGALATFVLVADSKTHLIFGIVGTYDSFLNFLHTRLCSISTMYMIGEMKSSFW